MATDSGQLITGLMGDNATTPKKPANQQLGAGAGGAAPPNTPTTDSDQMWASGMGGGGTSNLGVGDAGKPVIPQDSGSSGGGITPQLGAGAGGAAPPVIPGWGASTDGSGGTNPQLGSGAGGAAPPNIPTDTGGTMYYDPSHPVGGSGTGLTPAGGLGSGAGGIGNPNIPVNPTDDGSATGGSDDTTMYYDPQGGGSGAGGGMGSGGEGNGGPTFNPTDGLYSGDGGVNYIPPDDPSNPTGGDDTLIQAKDPTRSPEEQALIDQLMARANQGTAIDPNDPNIKQQVDAYAAQADRANRNYLSDQAESNSPYSTGQMANIQRMTAEKEGQDVGGFASTLVGKELTARRDEIQNALTQLGSTLSDEQKNALQTDLANLNAAIQQKQMGNQNSQFYAGLSQQDQQFVSQLQQNERFKNMDDALARYNTVTQNAQFFAKLAQDKDIAGMQNALAQSQLAQQDKEFLLQLAQTGDYQKAEEQYKTLALAQDNNQFMAKLAQEGNIAQLDDIFRKMQLAQNESQFLDQLGFNVDQQQNYWDWLQRGNSPPAS